jgi:hypothetical protein
MVGPVGVGAAHPAKSSAVVADAASMIVVCRFIPISLAFVHNARSAEMRSIPCA